MKKVHFPIYLILIGAMVAAISILPGCSPKEKAPDSLEGEFTYEDFEKPGTCGDCHQQNFINWEGSMMAASFTHEWDAVEYFQLALPHSQMLDEVSEVESGCVSCHGPLAYLAGDIPPPHPDEGGRVNEGVSCEICHFITGSTEPEPFNFSAVMDVGDTRYGPTGAGESPFHQIEKSDFLTSAEMCAICHDEKSPYGAWVKETYREWSESHYSQEGTTCQDCHMVAAGEGQSSGHTFEGPRSPERLQDAVTITLETDRPEARAGQVTTLYVNLENDLCGHYFPSGSSEERMLWLEVWLTDHLGEKHHLPVHSKGFEGEEYTIADSTALEYRDIGEIMGIEGFEGLSRDGDIPDGARIFRRPFFNPQGEMTICQWYTSDNTLVDYRFAPGETRQEMYTTRTPDGLSHGRVTFDVTLYYSPVPSSIGEFFELPAEDYMPRVVASESVTLDIVDWG